MNKLLIPVILSIIILLGITTIYADEDEELTTIPSWIKGVANFWIDGGINDAEFIEALEFLIDSNIIKLGDSIVVDNTVSVITTEQKDILDLTISQKEDRIKILENEVNVLNNKITSMPVHASESEMITNLNEQIQTLHDKLDKGEEAKDEMEEDLMKDINKLRQSYDTDTGELRKNWGDEASKHQLLQTKYDLLKAELDTLKQN
jgi:hypothetical protein